MGLHPNDFLWRNQSLRPSAEGTQSRSLSLRWLGTAGYVFSCEGHTLLIDPYITRISLFQFLFSRVSPDSSLLTSWLPQADAIVVGHSHFDHVMDVPDIARTTGACVWGSRSTANLMRSHQIPEGQIVECTGGEEFEVGPFRVKLIPSEHSRFALGGRVPYPGDIPCSCDIPLKGSEYRCGQVFGVLVRVGNLSIYHAGSANLIDDAIHDKDIDVFLMGISGRHATEQYIPRVLRRLTPRIVMPMHYDNFFRSAQKSMKLLPKTAFGRFVDEVTGFDRQIDLATLNLGEEIRLDV